MSTAAAQSVIYVVEPFGGSIRRHNPQLPLIFADDAAVTRGDGIFETMVAQDYCVANLSRHSQRFERSAQALELPRPHLDNWLAATAAALADWGPEEAKVTWTYTRGRAGTDIPSAWVTVDPVPAQLLRQRREGVRAMLAARSWTVPEEIPAKTVNYAATMAMLRLARRRDCDDVIFVQPDTGALLEGATSSLIVLRSKKLRTPAAAEILPSTTQRALFDYASEQGYRCAAKTLYPEDLWAADGVWLLSSVRGAVPVRALDGKELPAPAAEVQQRFAALVAGSVRWDRL